MSDDQEVEYNDELLEEEEEAYLEDEEEEEEADDEKEEEEKPETDYETAFDEEEEYKDIQIIRNINEKDDRHLSIVIVKYEDRMSSDVIQDTEMCEAIGIRISQIVHGSPVFAQDVSGYTNPSDMAKREFIERRNPLKLWREMSRTDTKVIVEEWVVRDMAFPMFDREILAISDKEIKEVLHKARARNPRPTSI